MSMYKVIVGFADLKDRNHPYHVGDIYPRDGYTPSDERIAELAGKKNKMGVALIKEDKPARKPRSKQE